MKRRITIVSLVLAAVVAMQIAHPVHSSASGHTPPTVVIDGHQLSFNTEDPLSGCKTGPESDGVVRTGMIWAGGRITGPETRNGPPGRTTIMAETKGVIAILLAPDNRGNQTSYSLDPNDSKSGHYTMSGPENSWYTFSGTIAEAVYSEATGKRISTSGVYGPLHQFTLKIECAKYGRPGDLS